jgi:hypothetical protein
MHIEPKAVVESTNVVSAGYDPEFKVLMVEFKGGSVYLYADCPPEVWEEMQKATSAGKFLNQVVKPACPNYMKIR